MNDYCQLIDSYLKSIKLVWMLFYREVKDEQ